ncbi:MAG: peptidylprolyl isomerase, partial [Runella zeae]
SEVKRFFNSIPKDSLPYIPAEVEIGHIVRYAQVTKAQKEELRNRLLEFKARIEKGEDFASLASAYSEDIESAKQGGDLGFAQRGSMVPEYEGAALKLKINEISEPIESEYGLHLIQLLETRGAEYHSRHILLRPDYNRMDLSAPKRILDSLQHLIQIDSLKFEIAAKKWSEDKNTADAGGLLKEQQTGNSRLPLDASMDYNLYMMLDTMKVGTISAPLNYRTDDGKTAMRIVYYKSKIDPHTANLKDDFEKLTNIVLANKKTKAVDEWFKKAVTDVFINVEPEYQGCKIFGINEEGN